MGKVRCLYCGASIADDIEFCSACGKPSHYQQRGPSISKQTRFIVYFILLVVFVAVMVVWLPR